MTVFIRISKLLCSYDVTDPHVGKKQLTMATRTQTSVGTFHSFLNDLAKAVVFEWQNGTVECIISMSVTYSNHSWNVSADVPGVDDFGDQFPLRL